MTSATPKPRAGEHVETDALLADPLLFDTRGGWMKQYMSARIINHARKLEAERDLLRSENAKLAAGSCVHELVGDPYGHFECSAVIALRERERELVEVLRALTQVGTIDGNVVVGPRGWEMAQAALAKVRP